jgi:fatty acid desaturase
LSEKQARLHTLENQIKRLQRRIDSLDRRSNRIGWIRVAIFFAGSLLSILAYFLVGWWLLLTGAALTLTIFGIVTFSWSYRQEHYAAQNLDADQSIPGST